MPGGSQDFKSKTYLPAPNVWNVAGGRDHEWLARRGVPAPTSYSLIVYRVFLVVGNYRTDLNGDGRLGAGDPVVPNVTVRFLDDNDNIVATTLTDANGSYEFVGTSDESYRVEFVAPSGHIFTLRDQGDDATDSDVDSSGRSASFTLTDDTVIDAGLVAVGSSLASIAGGIWADDGDGVRESDELPVSGVPVSLLDADGAVVGSTTTNSAGDYLFADRPQGFYRVALGVPAGYSGYTLRDVGNDALDSDVDRHGDSAFALLTAAGLAFDGGLTTLAGATVSGRVWDDADADGVQDSSEYGAAGVAVTLFDANMAAVASATTGTNGAYSFANLVPGQYRVGFAGTAGYAWSPRNGTPNPALDSDADATGLTGPVSVGWAATAANLDAGRVFLPPPGHDVTGRAWDDADADGVQDAGEAGFAGVAVRLLDPAGIVVAAAVTDAAGNYTFAGVAPGDYRVEFVAPAGHIFALRDRGGNDAADSDVFADGSSALFSLAAPADLDAGLVYRGGGGEASVTGTVWHCRRTLISGRPGSTKPQPLHRDLAYSQPLVTSETPAAGEEIR